MDVTGLGTSAVAEDEDEESQNLILEVEREELSDEEAFFALWTQIGEGLIDNLRPDTLSAFLDQSEVAAFFNVEVTAFVDDGDQLTGLTLGGEFEPDFEPFEEEIDDLDGCDCSGDSDETD